MRSRFRRVSSSHILFSFQVTSQGALIRYPPIHHRQGLITTTLGLRFTLSSRHFQGGSMKVKCIASVSPSLLRTDRESIVQNLPIKDMREALLLGEWTTFIQSPWHGVYHAEVSSQKLGSGGVNASGLFEWTGINFSDFVGIVNFFGFNFYRREFADGILFWGMRDEKLFYLN